MPDTNMRLIRFNGGPMRQPTAGKPKHPLTGDAAFLSEKAFESAAGRAGVWESTAGTFQANNAGYIEFGYIVEGACRLVDPDGTVHALAVGDAFVMPEGYNGRWEIDAFVKKIFFIGMTQ